MKRAAVLVLLALVCLAASVFRPLLESGFIAFDDNQYVTENRRVRQGLTRETMGWAFSSIEASNWHPLTWLSHALDVELHGMDPHGHHLTSLLLHLANTFLLGLVLRAMTGRLLPSAFVAALFALHPLHVESVAWVAERKDVLSAFFFLLTLAGYLRYARAPAAHRYAAALACFALGLMAKPMVITLPFLLLLLDYWPLGRLIGWHTQQRAGGAATALRLVLEKAPFFLLSAGSAVITFIAQRQSGSIMDEHFPPVARIFNALTAYVRYLGKAVWPETIAIFYPHPGAGVPWPLPAAAGFALLAASLAAIRLGRRLPFLPVGWLWYLGMLVPVIGFVQVGMQGMADRYTYLPLIGIFLLVAWGIPPLLEGWRHRERALAGAALLTLSALSVATHLQSRAWRDSWTLFSEAARRTGDNWQTEYSFGFILSQAGDTAAAAGHYRSALQLRPDFYRARVNLANILAAQDREAEAMVHYREAIRIEPSLPFAHVGLGNLLTKQGRFDEAAASYQEARRLDPEYAMPVFCLGLLEEKRGNLTAASQLYREALRLRPDYQEAANNLAILLVGRGQPADAIRLYEQTLALNPDFDAGHFNLATILVSRGEIDQAVSHYREALRINPAYREARLALDRLLGTPPLR